MVPDGQIKRADGMDGRMDAKTISLRLGRGIIIYWVLRKPFLTQGHEVEC